MTIDEAIKHCEEVAERYERVEDSHADEKLKEECLQCAADHWQLAGWLRELKQLRDRKRAHWLICSDGYYPYCSECGHWPKEMSKFCPCCGAEMYGDDREEKGGDKGDGEVRKAKDDGDVHI